MGTNIYVGEEERGREERRGEGEERRWGSLSMTRRIEDRGKVKGWMILL